MAVDNGCSGNDCSSGNASNSFRISLTRSFTGEPASRFLDWNILFDVQRSVSVVRLAIWAGFFNLETAMVGVAEFLEENRTSRITRESSQRATAGTRIDPSLAIQCPESDAPHRGRCDICVAGLSDPIEIFTGRRGNGCDPCLADCKLVGHVGVSK